MRVSTAHSFDATVATLQKRQESLTTVQEQMSSGKRVNIASDDPTSAARAERARALTQRIATDKRASDISQNVMTLSESALSDASELLQKARETMVAAGNGSYTAAERQSQAAKLKEIRNQLLTIANRSDGSGGYLFGGQGSSSPPFIDAPGGVVFRGQGGRIEIGSDETMPLTVDGAATWLTAPTGNGTFETRAVTSAGSGWINAGSVTDPAQITGATYDINFSVAGGVTTYTISANPGTAGTPVSGTFEPGKAIGIEGMDFTISGQPADGDAFQIAPSTNTQSIFDTLDQAIAGLQNTGANNGQVMQTVNSGLRNLDSTMTRLQGVQAEVGEVLTRIEDSQGRMADATLAAKTDQSNAEDLDMVQAISDFQNQQSGYEAALKAYSAVQRLSLFQYIT